MPHFAQYGDQAVVSFAMVQHKNVVRAFVSEGSDSFPPTTHGVPVLDELTRRVAEREVKAFKVLDRRVRGDSFAQDE